MNNALKTTLLLGLLTGLILLLGDFFGGQRGLVMALVFAGLMNFVSYFYSDKIALAMYRAQPAAREQLPRVYDVVERMTQRVGLPMPRIYVIPSDSPQRICHGPQSRACFRGGDSGHPRSAQR
jgi:heat shock protein HtpX